MDLQEVYNRLLFYINKAQGGWYPPEELDRMVDDAQLSYYDDCYVKYGTGERLTDALANFKKKVAFTTDANGLITTPDDYMNLISITPEVGGVPRSCPLVNEDEITYRRNSQIIPNTTSNPFGEIVADWNFQLYPKVQQSGTLSYYGRPVAPKFNYTIVSGRIIIYNQGLSTQLGWPDNEIKPLLMWTLQSIGINLSEQDIQNFGEVKTQQNLLSTIKT